MHVFYVLPIKFYVNAEVTPNKVKTANNSNNLALPINRKREVFQLVCCVGRISCKSARNGTAMFHYFMKVITPKNLRAGHTGLAYLKRGLTAAGEPYRTLTDIHHIEKPGAWRGSEGGAGRDFIQAAQLLGIQARDGAEPALVKAVEKVPQ